MIRPLIFIFALAILADAASAKDEKSIKRFEEAIVALAPDVDPGEAQLVSVTAHHTARQLAREYRVVGPPFFQNFLIHLGVRQRGYCYHWAYDIGARLKELRLKTLELHWGASDEGTRLESNCVVVTARGQPFNDGFIMDGWRMAGRLCWWPVKKDSVFLWKENMHLTAWLQKHSSPDEKPDRARTRSSLRSRSETQSSACGMQCLTRKSPSGHWGRIPLAQESGRGSQVKIVRAYGPLTTPPD